jgi:hypothetical protein
MERPTGIAAIKVERDEWVTAAAIAEAAGDDIQRHLAEVVANRLSWALAILGAETLDENKVATQTARAAAR